MATPNRMALLTKMHRVLKKHYKPAPAVERPVLEQLLFACCLENAPYEAAERALAAVSSSFFDWNEVRVSTVKELSEVMHMLPEPAVAAAHLKKVLQGVFESTYSFDLEPLKKQNLGQAQQQLKKIGGATPFATSFVIQTALGGHAIGVDRGLLEGLAILGAVTDEDKAAGVVPGLERAIPKNKGIEFGSLAHQFGADFVANPYSPALHKILLEVSPEAKDRLPKRPAKAAKAREAERPAAAATADGAAASGEAAAQAVTAEQGDGKAKPAAKRPAETGRKKPPRASKRSKEAVEGSAPQASTGRPVEPKVERKKKSAAIGLSKRKPR